VSPAVVSTDVVAVLGVVGLGAVVRPITRPKTSAMHSDAARTSISARLAR
jgi:hypothetical protein